MNEKVIIYGGTFDPIHNGHLAVAGHAIEQLGADKLLFVPAKRSPHKKEYPAASGDDRLAMITIAISHDERLGASDVELCRPEPSYTIDTIEHLKTVFTGAQLYLLIGADGIKDLSKWYRIHDLLEQCAVCLMLRPGYKIPDLHHYDGVLGRDNVEKLERHLLMNPLVDVSSTEIRRRLAAGEDVSSMLPPEVLAYINDRHLYRLPGPCS